MIDFKRFNLVSIPTNELEILVSKMKNPKFLEECLEELANRNTDLQNSNNINVGDCYKNVTGDIITYYKITDISKDRVVFFDTIYIINSNQTIERTDEKFDAMDFYTDIVKSKGTFKVNSSEYIAVNSICDNLTEEVNNIYDKYFEELKSYI